MEKTCPVCRTPFVTNDGKKQKTTCSRSCSNTYFRDVRHTLTSRSKRSATLLGRKVVRPRLAQGLKHCVVCDDEFMCRRSAWNQKVTCGKRKCVSFNRSQKLKGRTGGPRPGGGWGKQTEYANVMWDSTWEARLAQRLDALNIRWVRPGKELRIPYTTVDGKHRNYYPDIFLPDSNLFLEVKGHWTPESLHRVQQCQLQHRIIVLETLDAIDGFTGV